MVGDGSEVERAIEARGAGRLLAGVGDGDGCALREGVRIVRFGAGAIDVRVGGEARMDMQVAEEWRPERLGAGTRLAGLGAWPGRRRGAAGRGAQNGDGERQPESSARRDTPKPSDTEVFAVKPRRSVPRTSFDRIERLAGGWIVSGRLTSGGRWDSDAPAAMKGDPGSGRAEPQRWIGRRARAVDVTRAIGAAVVRSRRAAPRWASTSRPRCERATSARTSPTRTCASTGASELLLLAARVGHLDRGER